MNRALATEELFDRVADGRRKRLLGQLRLWSIPGRRPGRPSVAKFRERFYRVAEGDLRRKARRYFRRFVERRVERNWTFDFRRQRPDAVAVWDRVKALRGKGFIYIFFGYKGKRRACLYVGRTRGSGGRIAEHRGIVRRNRVTQIKVFKVKNRRGLGAAECLAVHRYAPLKNAIRPARPRAWVKCVICRRIRRAWKEFRPLIQASV